MLKKRISGSHRWEETNAVSPNICDDKQRFAKYVWKKLPEIFDDKSDITLNTAELLPNMCDNHHRPKEPKKAKEPKDPYQCWDALATGRLDWSRTAMRYWPDRVMETGRKNWSYAIAHGLVEYMREGE